MVCGEHSWEPSQFSKWLMGIPLGSSLLTAAGEVRQTGQAESGGVHPGEQTQVSRRPCSQGCGPELAALAPGICPSHLA